MTASTRRKLSLLVTLVICSGVVVVAMAWLSGAFRRGQIEPGLRAQAPAGTLAEPSGPVAVVEKVARPASVDLVGTIQSELRTTIASRLTALINTISVNAGDAVKKGDVLVHLDDRDIRARVAQAREAHRSAAATRDFAKHEYDRLRPLAERGAASSSEVDSWRTKYDGAEADVTRAQRVIEEAEVQLSDTTLLAPFDGVIIDRQAEPGDLASPGKSLLTIYDPSRMRLEASVREAYIGRLDELRKAEQPLTVIVQALGREIQGEVNQIVPTADPESRSFIVKVRLADSSGLYPGMFGRLRVPMPPQEVIVIPAAAVREIGQISLVEVAGPSGSHADAVQMSTRAVRLGRTDGDRVEVLAGLDAGERIVLPK